MCEDLIEHLKSHARRSGYVIRPEIEGYNGKHYRFGPQRLFDRVRKAAGLDASVTPHVLRHTFCSLCAQANVTLFKIGMWMGHTTSEMTEIYAYLAQYDSDIERLNFSGFQPAGEATIQGRRLGLK